MAENNITRSSAGLPPKVSEDHTVVLVRYDKNANLFSVKEVYIRTYVSANTVKLLIEAPGFY